MSMILVSTALFPHVCKQEAPIGWITHNDAMITRDQNQAITDGDLIMGPFQDPFRNIFFRGDFGWTHRLVRLRQRRSLRKREKELRFKKGVLGMSWLKRAHLNVTNGENIAPVARVLSCSSRAR